MANVQKRNIEDLKPHPKNPRKISATQMRALKKSLTADPDMLKASPIVCTEDGTIIFGHQRVKAAKELGWADIEVLEVKATEEEITKWMLKDNVHAGEFDESALQILLRETFSEMEDVVDQGLPETFAELLGDKSIVFDLELIATDDAAETLDESDDFKEEEETEDKVKVRVVGKIRLNSRADAETLLIAFAQNNMGKLIKESEDD